jgi:hypothetical protein
MKRENNLTKQLATLSALCFPVHTYSPTFLGQMPSTTTFSSTTLSLMAIVNQAPTKCALHLSRIWQTFEPSDAEFMSAQQLLHMDASYRIPD